ncbi:MAG TPA: hypothetical protein VKA28_03880 [Candidatus Bathyarchaeia archaeon]|nr:hypothetical protein [Candidatus Bathyarchaeia archaeon]
MRTCFFQAAEYAGMVYHLWTSVLHEHQDNRNIAEETLLKVLKSFQSRPAAGYIS